jgi:hypothetical protein
MTENIRVIPQDAPAAGMCLAGAREWAKLNGLDFRQFLKEGTPIEEIRALNCPLGNRVCDAAERRTAAEGNA